MDTTVTKFYLSGTREDCFGMLLCECKEMGVVLNDNIYIWEIKADLKLPKENQYNYHDAIPCQFNIIDYDGFGCNVCMTISSSVNHSVSGLLVYYLKTNLKRKYDVQNLNPEWQNRDYRKHEKPYQTEWKYTEPPKEQEPKPKSKQKKRKLSAVGVMTIIGYSIICAFYILGIVLYIPFSIILKTAGIGFKLPKMPKKPKTNLWQEVDHSYHFDEDPDMHDVDEDGYCYECDEYEEDML